MNTFNTVVDLYKDFDHEIENHGDLKFFQIRSLSTGLSITQKEVLFFERFKEEFKDPKIFIIGNAFGFSTFVLNEIFKGCSIDVIDAECEGVNNRQGSEITRKIIEKHNFDIRLTIGYSPEEVPNATRFDKYDIVFIDGLHTDDQLIKDFKAVKPYLNQDKFICFMHDVRLCKMEKAVEKILEQNQQLYDKYVVQLPEDISESGMGIVSKNVSADLF